MLNNDEDIFDSLVPSLGEQEVLPFLGYTTPWHTWAMALGITRQFLERWLVGGEDGEKYTVFIQAEQQGREVLYYWYRRGIPKPDEQEVIRLRNLYNMWTKPRRKSYRQCLYGGHLISGDAERTIVLCLDEPTAVVCAWLYRQQPFDFVAVGDGLTDYKTGQLIKWTRRQTQPLYIVRNGGLGSTHKVERMLKKAQLDNYRIVDLWPGQEMGRTTFGEAVAARKPEDLPYLGEHLRDGEAKDTMHEKMVRKLPSHVSEEEFARFNFYEENKRYWFWNKSGEQFQALSNFIMRPVFHITGAEKSIRLFELQSVNEERALVGLDTSVLTSLQSFRAAVEDPGNFQFDGDDRNLRSIKHKLYLDLKEAKEMRYLGWRPEGFWVWANGISTTSGKFIPYDAFGVAEWMGKHWFYRGASKAFASDEDDDIYSEDRKMRYVQDHGLDWKQLAAEFAAVFGQAGWLVLAYYLLTIFRDLVCQVGGQGFPMLFAFGEPGGGKTETSRWIRALFGSLEESEPVSYVSISHIALPRKAQQHRHTLLHVDEFKNGDPKKEDLVKNWHDSIGRTIGVKSTDNQTRQGKVYNGILLSGEHFPTYDALFSRVILEEYSRKQFTEEQARRFSDFKARVTPGVSSITGEVITHRDMVAAAYKDMYHQVRKSFKEEPEFQRLLQQADSSDREFSDRQYGFYVKMLAMVQLLQEVLPMPFSIDEFKQMLIERFARQQSLISQSSEAHSFMDAVESMADGRRIVRGEDYEDRLENHQIDLLGHDGKPKTIRLEEPARILYLRPSRIISEYRLHYRSTENAVAMRKQLLLQYIKKHPAFLGTKKSHRFGTDVNSNALVFRYDLCGIMLHGSSASEEVAAKSPF